MSVSKLPSGRWRAQINQDGRNISVPSIIRQELSESVCRVCEGPLVLDEDGLFAHKELCFECWDRRRF